MLSEEKMGNTYLQMSPWEASNTQTSSLHLKIHYMNKNMLCVLNVLNKTFVGGNYSKLLNNNNRNQNLQ